MTKNYVSRPGDEVGPIGPSREEHGDQNGRQKSCEEPGSEATKTCGSQHCKQEWQQRGLGAH